jgi:HK97 family phage major capsid protein
MQVRFVGGVPATVAVLNQAGYEAIRLMRENAASGTYGNYLFGPPSQAAPLTIFGLTVALAQSVPANTAFVLNATATTLALVERMGAAILTGWINDQFTRNMLTLLAEGRWLMIYRRPKGIYKLTGMP